MSLNPDHYECPGDRRVAEGRADRLGQHVSVGQCGPGAAEDAWLGHGISLGGMLKVLVPIIRMGDAHPPGQSISCYGAATAVSR